MNNRLKQRGVTLIKAIIAVAVMASGTAAVFGIHSYVSSTSAESRIETAAQGLAQEKLEELRAQHFLMIQATGHDLRTISLPMLGGSRDLVFKRCWQVLDTASQTEIPNNRLKRLQVNIVNESAECNSPPIATLSTFLASQDPRAAARNVDEQIRADGDAIKENYNPDDLSHNRTDGFIFEDGKIYNPQTGEYLRPKVEGQPLRYTTISGNLFFYSTPLFIESDDLPVGGDDSTDLAPPPLGTIEKILNSIRVSAQGAATCRIFYPEFNTNAEPGQFQAADGKQIKYLQYSCIVADQWRRSIVVRPAKEQEVCVGYSLSQTPFLADDVLKQSGRVYFGFIEKGIPTGVRGSDQPDESVIGSLCEGPEPSATATNACWLINDLRGLVPGGHHFLVKPKDTERCDVTLANAFIPTAPNSYSYTGLIQRNPGTVYCVNDPTYTNKMQLPNITEAEETIATTSDCYSFTRASGFITPQSNPATELEIKTTPTRTCPVFYLNNTKIVGGYLCDFVDLEINTPREISVSVEPKASAKVTFAKGETLFTGSDANKLRFLPYAGVAADFENAHNNLHDLTNYNLVITPKD